MIISLDFHLAEAVSPRLLAERVATACAGKVLSVGDSVSATRSEAIGDHLLLYTVRMPTEENRYYPISRQEIMF